MDVETDARSNSPLPERPFQRALRVGDPDAVERVKESCKRILSRLNVSVPTLSDEEFLTFATNACCAEWRLRQQNSEIALKVAFWKIAVPLVYDSDLSFGTQFRDSLLFSLALYDVNNSKNRLRELYAAVPGVRQSMLGVHAKRFGEKYRHIQMVRSRANSRMSSRHGSAEDLLSLDNDTVDDQSDGASEGLSTGTGVGGLTNTSHHKQRVINVSNAPPVSIQRKGSGCWEIKQGSGGLVSCVDPVMSVDKENIWLSNLGINIKEERDEMDVHPPSTNSLGLPLIKQARAGEIFHVLEENDKKQVLTDKEQLVERDMSLLSVLHDYNRTNYQLNPVFVSQEDYNAYYGGISNGLLWPALHNLAEYIVKEYDDPAILREHWCAYVRVNYQFGINAARNSRPQDFIWIHDYHLMLTGQIMRSLDSNLEVGFFLHIPFQPPPNFMTKYKLVADPILRGILRFTKVGFQTHRDRERYVQMVREHIPRARVHYDTRIDIFTITYEGWTCSLGVFPVSIKNEDFLSIANEPQCAIDAQEIRQEVLAHSGEGGCFFFSVERFDYTKGIMEKLKAWKRQAYFEKHPERKGLDVLYQVAVTNRRAVESYKKYQDSCLAVAHEINDTIKSDAHPEWKPLRFETDGLPRTRLVAHYLAMDIGVVTPSKDGMNLVAKEMMVCNPGASLVLSSGAGTEVQLGNAGFYSEDKKYYHRVDDISDTENFAEVFYRAATEERALRQEHGGRLNQFLKSHDIDEWSSAFLDPGWTHEVIRPCEIKQLADFYMLMAQTAQIRRQIVEVVLKGMPIRPHFALSLENAKNSLENSCVSDTNRLVLETTSHAEDADGANTHATFDITDELTELQKDLAFLSFIQSDEINNVEQFIDTLGSFHPSGPTAFAAEVEKAASLLSQGDHFHYVFTDRDGTLKSYSCSYPTSVQPAYSAVIQAQFARRCAQFCAIVTTAPLVHIGILNMSTMPEGYYAYGASAGREWYFNPAMQFKDDSVSDADLMLLNKAFDKVEDLLENPEFRNFTWIGSGLQKHYGHITIAKQDVNNSIPHRKSSLLLDEVTKIVNEVDPSGAILTIRENEYDIKIFTKAKLSGRIFNKGHGVRLIERKMGMQLQDGNVLVCGDSETDLPMLEECLSVAPPNVYTIWVTKDEALQAKVTQTCAQFHNNNVTFVSCPEVLLGAMAQATVRELRVRGDLEGDCDM
ncbi:trehalose-6-phosphate synthase domain protein [Necator americanus]|uniref:alpha,alpha-trehalose-phosphate synthase (UDP-forming) n=1 Tax=Necator americanus TaxID=51031 RepID=W2TMX5_NECAM|nr:trehalose-6-phosphate synthase domain protein [Necator americanus]ETN83455.1 trehalose-6-phosphate synthase domain protein [Necator americanus]